MSLAKFSKLTEAGVLMQSPFDPTQEILLSPEESMVSLLRMSMPIAEPSCSAYNIASVLI